jgi:DNA-binding protein Fis
MEPLLHHPLLALLAATIMPNTAEVPRMSTTPREINITTDSAQGWLPSQKLEHEVKKTVDRYFAAVDSGKPREAYEMMSGANKAILSFEEFERESNQFHALAGPLLRREVLKITWTKDPANAPYPGVYAAVDESAIFKGVERQCGYLIIYQNPASGELAVMRVENNFIDNLSAAKIAQTQSVSELNNMWAALSGNCPNFPPAR